MNQKTIIIVVLICVTLLALAWMYNNRIRMESQQLTAQNQIDMVYANIAQQEACDRSWQCTATNLLTGAGGIVGGLFN